MTQQSLTSQTTKAAKSVSAQGGFSEELASNLTAVSEKQRQHAEKLRRAYEDIAALKILLQTDYLTIKDFAKSMKEKVTLEEMRQEMPNTQALKLELIDYMQTIKHTIEENTTDKIKGVDSRLVALRIDTNVEAFKQALQKKANADEVNKATQEYNSRLQQTELSQQVAASDIRQIQQLLFSL